MESVTCTSEVFDEGPISIPVSPSMIEAKAESVHVGKIKAPKVKGKPISTE